MGHLDCSAAKRAQSVDQRFAIHCCHLCCVPITLARLQQM